MLTIMQGEPFLYKYEVRKHGNESLHVNFKISKIEGRTLKLNVLQRRLHEVQRLLRFSGCLDENQGA